MVEALVTLHSEACLAVVAVLAVLAAAGCGYIGLKFGQLMGPGSNHKEEPGPGSDCNDKMKRTSKVYLKEEADLQAPNVLYRCKTGWRQNAMHFFRDCSHINSKKDSCIIEEKLCVDCFKKLQRKLKKD
jgi:hypothetical protein